MEYQLILKSNKLLMHRISKTFVHIWKVLVYVSTFARLLMAKQGERGVVWGKA